MADILSAAQINQLKTALTAEVARRKGYGSLSTNSGYGYAEPSKANNYASSAYNFTTTPVSGGLI